MIIQADCGLEANEIFMTTEVSKAPLGERECDVAIIGGGPAGSTAASLLARQGYKVVVFEKTPFPRFHIGESLLPANLRLLDELGVREQVEALALRKNGIELVSPVHEKPTMLEFADCWDKTMPYSFHVRRSQFDKVLLDNARRLGADVHEGIKVSGVELGEGCASSLLTVQPAANAPGTGPTERWRARFVIDASGRETLLSTRLKLKQRNPHHNSAALYGHFEGATRLAGDNEGNISIFWFEHGWFWFIPLADGITSVGAVCWPYYLKSRDTDVNTFLDRTIALCPPLAARLAGATRVADATATGNYSYGSQRSHGRNFLLIGDAYAFVDPVFSSGVYLAMNSAFAGARAVDACLSRPATATAALRRFDKVMLRGPREFSWFIYRITKPALRDIFMAPRNPLRVKEALLSVLAGDIFENRRIWPSVYAFKGIYYLSCLRNLPMSWREWRRRRRIVGDVAGLEAGFTDR